MASRSNPSRDSIEMRVCQPLPGHISTTVQLPRNIPTPFLTFAGVRCRNLDLVTCGVVQ
jgi:hypothetical protein